MSSVHCRRQDATRQDTEGTVDLIIAHFQLPLRLMCFMSSSSTSSSSLSTVTQVKDRLPNLKAIVQYLPGEVDEEQKAQGVMSWQEFREYGNVNVYVLVF